MIEIREEAGIAILELAHGKANALDLELCHRLVELLADFEREPVLAIVLTARGTIFSAGVDLMRLIDGGPDYAREFVPALVAAVRAMFVFPKPVVAALNGHAIAGGCVLACAADRRLIVDTGARVGVPELRVGVPFPVAAIEIMRTTLTPARFRSLIYGGVTLEPLAAREWGLVDQVVPADELLDAAITAARDLASIPAPVFFVTKMQMRKPALDRMMAADQEFGASIIKLWTEPETVRVVRDYVRRIMQKEV